VMELNEKKGMTKEIISRKIKIKEVWKKKKEGTKGAGAAGGILKSCS